MTHALVHDTLAYMNIRSPTHMQARPMGESQAPSRSAKALGATLASFITEWYMGRESASEIWNGEAVFSSGAGRERARQPEPPSARGTGTPTKCGRALDSQRRGEHAHPPDDTVEAADDG